MSSIFSFTSDTSTSTVYLGSYSEFDDRFHYSCCFLDFFTHSQVFFEENTIETIKIKCNLTSGTFSSLNNKYTHTIYEFTPISNQYKIIEKSQNLVYLPANIRGINTVSISIVDQNDKPVNFNGQKFTCHIHIKKNDYISESTSSL